LLNGGRSGCFDGYIIKNNDDISSTSEIDWIEQLTNKFKSAFLINDF